MAQGSADIGHINKWELFRELCVARAAFDVTDRDLTVLNALLSFHQAANLNDNAALIVYPSNKALAERAHGMAESTLRRHLGALVRAGLIQRHDSPNGKRYAARDGAGELVRAFGFDLRPLLIKAREITQAATGAREAALRLKRLREEVSLLKRDAQKLLDYSVGQGTNPAHETLQRALSEAHRAFRRQIDTETLTALRCDLTRVLKDLHTVLETEKTGGNDVPNERHYQNSNTDSYDFEPCQEKGNGSGRGAPELAERDVEVSAPKEEPAEPDPNMPKIPLALVLRACPEIELYSQGGIRHWHELSAAAGFVRGMMGISPDAWERAVAEMGRENAAITVAGILQRVAEIGSPGGYLRALTRKAGQGGYSPGPMIMALLSVEKVGTGSAS